MKVNFREMFSTFSKNVNEHKPEIATGAGLLFMLGGTAVAVVATVKTMKALEKEKDEKLQEICPDGNFEELTAEEQQAYDNTLIARPSIKDVARVGWKWWILPAGLLAAGTGSILYSDKEQAKRIAGLMAKAGALAFQVAESKDYREAAREILGEEKEKEIDDRAAKKSVERRTDESAYVSVNYPHLSQGNDLYQEYYSKLRFYADWNYIESCLNKFNRRLNEEQAEGNEYIGLYEWYDILGLTGYTGKAVADRPGCGEDLAFRTDKGLLALSECQDNAFKTEDNINCYVVRFTSRPQYRSDLF